MTQRLYRRLLREISDVPVGPIRRKLKHNVRVIFESHKAETNPDELERLKANAWSAVRVLSWLKCLPEVLFDGPHRDRLYQPYTLKSEEK